MKVQTKIVKKPTPIRNAMLVCSLTCNAFLGIAAYGVYSGKLARTDVQVASVQPVALYEQDYVTTLAGRK